jgi:cell division protease FtsH
MPDKPKQQITMKKRSVSSRISDFFYNAVETVLLNLLKFLLAGSAAVLMIIFFIGISILAPGAPGQQIPLTEALTQITTNKVGSPTLQQVTLRDQDSRIELVTSSGQQEWSAYPHSDSYTADLIGTLSSKRVRAIVDPQDGKPTLRLVVQFLLPILILATLFAFFTLLARESGGMIAAFSKASGKKQKVQGKFTFADVAGAPEALVELREFVDYLDNPMKYANLGARAPKGVILTGPPGTGKTLLARAVAGEANANFFAMSGSEFVESLVGVGAARVRDLFAQARNAAPSIIFIDEIDAVGRQRGAGMGQGHDEREQTLNQMLVEMDGFGAESGVVVMAATNRPDILDNALLRPGRYDRQVVVDLPDVYGRTEILQLYAKKAPLSPHADLSRIAHQTPGMSGADLANVINEAALLAVRASKAEIEQEELEEAIDRTLLGPARKSHLLSREEIWRIAVHESGHAIVAESIEMPVALQKLSVVARGRGRGGATIFSSGDSSVMTHLDLMKTLVVTMGGAAAEHYVFGTLSTGVEEDIEKVTKMAHSMVSVYGMSPAIGPVAIGEKEGQVFVGRDLANMGNVAAASLELVDSETRRIVHEAEEIAKNVIALNRSVLEDLANSLVRAETLSGPSLDVYLEAVEVWHEPLLKELGGFRTPVRMRNGDEDGEGDKGLIWRDEE